MEGVTDSLRRSAPQWSLAGDQELLDALQTLHQKIMQKCQETNKKLDEMVMALDHASVNLQNVNNKFTALSNSQFIESRVYDDDVEVAPEKVEPQEEPKKSNPDSEMEDLQRSLKILEEYHEVVTIVCDSDSDTSDDEESMSRVVLKPKDLYAHRPLPYIIGSQAWKSKWHAGLLPDDSDSESDHSKPGVAEQYSDSEPERSESAAEPPWRDRTISSSSSDLHSEQDEPAHSLPSAGPKPKPTQSDIAAELARRLGGVDNVVKKPERDIDYGPPEPTTRKVYEPEKPTPGQVFFDEPPPLETDQSEESEDDIFAEINKNQPYKQSSREQSSIADDLFGKPIFDEVENDLPPKPVAKQKSLLFDEDSEPELFVEKPKPTQDTRKQEEVISKKPIGGMSLFGSNAESIGAAILKRNQRQSSSDTESDDSKAQTKKQQPHIKNKPQVKNSEVKTTQVTKDTKVVHDAPPKKERDIFDDLFAKSVKINREKEQEKIKKDSTKKDLFSGNLFDDIDDIFTSSVDVKVKDSKRERSIFDDDDDLFSDVTVVKNVAQNNDASKPKNIFGSNEDLFGDQLNTKIDKTVATKVTNKVGESIKESRSIFDDDDDDLFSDVSVTKILTKTEETTKVVTKPVIPALAKNNELFNDTDEDDNLFVKNVQNKPAVAQAKPNLIIKENNLRTEEQLIKPSAMNSPNIFDDEDDYLFSSTQTQLPKNNKNIASNAVTTEHSGFFKPDDASVAEIIVTNDGNNVKNMQEKEVESLKMPPKPDIPTKPVLKKESTSISQNTTSEENAPKLSNTDDIVDKVTNNISENEDTVFKTMKLPEKPKLAPKPNATPNISSEETNTDIPIRTDYPRDLTTENVKDTVQSITNENKTVTNIFDSEPPAFDTTLIDKNTNLETPKKDLLQKDSSPEVKPVVFTDIFNDQPPEFEKPKEPKKSKNVNALFDDDSDDEALFFKKNDATLDEKPELFSSPTEDRLFDLFITEPPAIDVDFVQKPIIKDSEVFVDDNYDNFIQKVDKSPAKLVTESSDKKDFDNLSRNDIHSQNLKRKDGISKNKEMIAESNTDLFNSKKELINDLNSDMNDDDIFEKSPLSKSTFDDSDGGFSKSNFDSLLQNDDDLFKTSKPKVESKKPDLPYKESNKVETTLKENEEHKKVGKLKPMNFNINVNTLLPGASPKKVAKSTEQTDGQVISTKSNEDVRLNENMDEDNKSKLVKSISFEDKPDATMLDNKLSKERAKIQVKRRPSTRRARREAVKKSGIEFGEDTTDNSSSYDDPPKSPVSPKKEANAEDNRLHSDENDNSKMSEAVPSQKESLTRVTSPTKDIFTSRYKEPQTKEFDEFSTITDDFDDLFKPTNEADRAKDVDNDKNRKCIEFTEENSHKTINVTHPTTNLINKDIDQKTTGISSINQDNTKTEISKSNESDVKSKLVYILNDEDIFNTKKGKSNPLDSDDDELFKTANASKSLDKEKVVEETTTKSEPKVQKSLQILDSDDDNLFKDVKTVKTVEKQVMKQNQPDNRTNKSIFDSDDDTELFSKNKKVEKPTKSLFSSDSDEELFGKSKGKGRSVERETKRVETSVKKEIKRVEVKGSLFGDDDDDDLFGVKTKKPVDTKPHPSKYTARETVKSTEPVFQDPLSLFGDDDDDDY